MSNLFSQVFLWVCITFVIRIVKVSYKYCPGHSTALSVSFEWPWRKQAFLLWAIHLLSFMDHSPIHSTFQPHWTSHHSVHTTGICICCSLTWEHTLGCSLLILTYSRFAANAFSGSWTHSLSIQAWHFIVLFLKKKNVTAFITWKCNSFILLFSPLDCNPIWNGVPIYFHITTA